MLNPRSYVLADLDYKVNRMDQFAQEEQLLKSKYLATDCGIKNFSHLTFYGNKFDQEIIPYLRVMLMSAKDLYDQKITNKEVMEGKVDFKREGDPNKYQLSKDLD